MLLQNLYLLPKLNRLNVSYINETWCNKTEIQVVLAQFLN